MDQKYLPIPIADPIYNFLVTNIHFVILPIADTNIFGRYSRYTSSRCNIGATLVVLQSLSTSQAEWLSQSSSSEVRVHSAD